MVVTQEMLVQFGRRLRTARVAKGLNQAEVARAIHLAQGQYSDIERAYIRPGQSRGAVPDDEFIAAVSPVLGVSVHDLNAALGRAPAGELAASLVREKLTAYGAGQGGDVRLSDEDMDRLIGELERYAEFTVGERVRELQAQGGR